MVIEFANRHIRELPHPSVDRPHQLTALIEWVLTPRKPLRGTLELQESQLPSSVEGDGHLSRSERDEDGSVHRDTGLGTPPTMGRRESCELFPTKTLFV
jgi:hypothetical protein